MPTSKNTPSTARAPRQYMTRKEAAARLQVTDRTISNWISRGLITGYRLPGKRAIRVEWSEVQRMIQVVPTTIARTPRTAFGPNAKIVEVPRTAEVYTPEADGEGEK